MAEKSGERGRLRIVRQTGLVVGSDGVSIELKRAYEEQDALRRELGDEAIGLSLPEMRRMHQAELDRLEILEGMPQSSD